MSPGDKRKKKQSTSSEASALEEQVSPPKKMRYSPKPSFSQSAAVSPSRVAPLKRNKSDVKREAAVKEKRANSIVLDWEKVDILSLISNMEALIPEDDTLKYETRVDHLDWEKIAFGNYSAEECKVMWLNIQARLRRFRLLKELVNDAKTWANQPWTNFYNGKKTNRHPDMPKKPLSTYMLFYMDKKDKVLRDNPGMDMTEITRVAAEMYRELTPRMKQKYEEKSARARTAYEYQMLQFYKKHPELQNNTTTERGAGNLKRGPVKPQTPFLLYFNERCVEKHKNDPEFRRSEILEKYRHIWKEMSEKKKAKWINRALMDEKRYQEELVRFKDQHPDFVPKPYKPILNKEEKLILDKIAGKPEPVPNSGYSLFSKQMLGSDELKTYNSKDRMKEISKRWKKMTEAQQKQYNDEASRALEHYKLAYAAYLESLPEEKRKEELMSAQKTKKRTQKKIESIEVEEEEEYEIEDDYEDEDTGEVEEDEEDTSEMLKPQRPNSALFHFSEAVMPRYKKLHPKISRQELTRLLAKEYTRLPESKKAKYKKMADDSKAKEETEKKNEQTSVKTELYNGEPDPPPATTFQLFLQTFLSDATHIPNKNRMNEAPRYWQMLPDTDKAKYRKKLNDLKQRYISNYEKFIRGLSQEELADYTMIKANRRKERQRTEESESDQSGEGSEDDNNADESGSDDDSSTSGEESGSESDSTAEGSEDESEDSESESE